ncbi:MAG TPA: hypothetical protein VF980_01805 [Thermoanaerobaculia bacterium]
MNKGVLFPPENRQSEDLGRVIEEMYASICYEQGGSPDWERNAAIFTPGARMVRINDDGIFEFQDQRAYRENFESMIASGDLPAFWEGELWRTTHVFHDMAHVLSAYETRRTRTGPVINRGVNSIQLFRRKGRWLISAMIWRREGKEFRIPEAPPSFRA